MTGNPMSDTPMTAPTTGATDLDAMVARMVLGSWNGGVFDLENIRTFARRLAPFAVPDGCVIVPATAVPDAEVRASWDVIKHYLGNMSPVDDSIWDSHDRIDAWLAQEGRDGNG